MCRPLAIFHSSLDKLCLHGDTTRTDLDLSVPAKGNYIQRYRIQRHSLQLCVSKEPHTVTASGVRILLATRCVLKCHILLQYAFMMQSILNTSVCKIFCIPCSVQTPWRPVEGAVTKWPHNCLWRRRSSISPQAAAVNREGMWTLLCFREWRFSEAPLMIRYLRNHETGIYPQIFRCIPQKAASQRWASAPYSSKYYRNKSNTNISAIYSNGLYPSFESKEKSWTHCNTVTIIPLMFEGRDRNPFNTRGQYWLFLSYFGAVINISLIFGGSVKNSFKICGHWWLSL